MCTEIPKHCDFEVKGENFLIAGHGRGPSVAYLWLLSCPLLPLRFHLLHSLLPRKMVALHRPLTCPWKTQVHGIGYNEINEFFYPSLTIIVLLLQYWDWRTAIAHIGWAYLEWLLGPIHQHRPEERKVFCNSCGSCRCGQGKPIAITET